MDRNRWHRASWLLAVSMMTTGLIGLTACGAKEDEAPPVEEAAPAPAAPAMPEATVVESMQLQTGAAALAGQTVRVNGLNVQSKLGTKAFWVQLPNKNPFLIVTAEDATVNNGATVDVVGTVTKMTPEILERVGDVGPDHREPEARGGVRDRVHRGAGHSARRRVAISA
jgi:hypothetical protein